VTGERDARRLSPEDLSILALEDDTVAGHMCKVIVLGRPRLRVHRAPSPVGPDVAAAAALWLTAGP